VSGRRSRCEQQVLEPEQRRDVLVAVTLLDQVPVVFERHLDDWQLRAVDRRHVVTDAEVLRVEPDAKPRRVGIAHDIRRAVHEVPARAGSLAQGLDQELERQSLGLRECHGLGHCLYDARAHDLVGRLGRLTGALCAEMRDRAAHRAQHRQCALKRRGLAADHDRERAVARTFDATADRRIEKLDVAGGETPCRLACRVAADRRAIDDECAGAEAGCEAIDDGEHIGIGRNAGHDAGALAGECRERSRCRNAELRCRVRGRRAGCDSRRPSAGRRGAGSSPCRAPWRRGRQTRPS
jgi:hypothetical protein